MERTPSPPPRLHTPPAPLHGDNYEPFSPRRSSRVAAQRALHQEPSSPTRARSTRDVTPTSSKRKPAVRASVLALSPPSSPISPAKHRSPRSLQRTQPETAPFDSDSDIFAPTPARRFLSTMTTQGMLPTPAKTPRKRPLQSEESLSSTARVLFADRPATVEEAMPTPRKARKSMRDVYTLESFSAQMDQAAEDFPIYTDSKERIPTRDDEEQNPFVTKKGKGKAKALPQTTRKVDPKTAEMNEAVNRDEGMVYLFRGKKIFRKFHDGPPSNASDEAPGDQLHREVGHEAHRPLTRSAIKPRLLFQEEIQRRKAENGDEDDDEEAVTDIEIPVATPSRKKGKAVVNDVAEIQDAARVSAVRPRREISFDSWKRVKSSSSSSSRDAKKRPGSPLQSGTDKRTRSERSSSPMSIDGF